jgi:hypothetical protein
MRNSGSLIEATRLPLRVIPNWLLQVSPRGQPEPDLFSPGTPRGCHYMNNLIPERQQKSTPLARFFLTPKNSRICKMPSETVRRHADRALETRLLRGSRTRSTMPREPPDYSSACEARLEQHGEDTVAVDPARRAASCVLERHQRPSPDGAARRARTHKGVAGLVPPARYSQEIVACRVKSAGGQDNCCDGVQELRVGQ